MITLTLVYLLAGAAHQDTIVRHYKTLDECYTVRALIKRELTPPYAKITTLTCKKDQQ